MVSPFQVFLVTFLFFAAVASVGFWAAFSARKAGTREKIAEEQQALRRLDANAVTGAGSAR